ncbi:MAG: YcfA-like protein [Methanosaeta sp. PtaB.Bin018]|nr:MAG: YcfA-like protein [Methanosaeta sp. PtaB.Bin018]OPY47226.1 MAG: YcfA-like protein [Methanosaeta sp. PtaU1.Bin016]
MPRLRGLSGEAVVKIFCNRFGFVISGRSGSHVRISKMTPHGKIGTVVPLHDELKPGTLKSVLNLAKIDPDDFAECL